MHLRAQEKGLPVITTLRIPTLYQAMSALASDVDQLSATREFTQQGGVTVRFGMKPAYQQQCF